MVGNLDAVRDFLDVRDVVAAYLALARDGRAAKSITCAAAAGGAVRDVLRELIAIAGVPVEVREDPERMRPLDVPALRRKRAKSLKLRPAGVRRFRSRNRLRDIYHAAREPGNPGATS